MLWSKVKNEIGCSGTLESLQKYILEKIAKWEQWNWAGKCYLEQAVQHPYPLEISCDITPSTKEPTMNVNAEEFWPRWNTSEIAWIRIPELALIIFYHGRFNRGRMLRNPEN